MNELLANCARSLLQTHKKNLDKELSSGKVEGLDLIFNKREDGMWTVNAIFTLKNRKNDALDGDEDEALAEIIELGIGMFGSKKMIFEHNISEEGLSMDDYDGISCSIK
jgi:hypothetical protein